MSTRGSGIRHVIPPAQQADAVLSQANPVSNTLYTVLATTRNVRIISIATNITWAVTQPTPIEVVFTNDGQTIVHQKGNPVSATGYTDLKDAGGTALLQYLGATDFSQYRSFMYEGRSVLVQARITWAVTQPTPLVCRVKWAKW